MPQLGIMESNKQLSPCPIIGTSIVVYAVGSEDPMSGAGSSIKGCVPVWSYSAKGWEGLPDPDARDTQK